MASGREQNTGAQQVNKAIQQLNIVIQQNSAASEELSSTAEEFAAEAEKLIQTISYFKFGDRTGKQDGTPRLPSKRALVQRALVGTANQSATNLKSLPPPGPAQGISVALSSDALDDKFTSMTG